MYRKTVLDVFKSAGLNDLQAEQVGGLYKRLRVLEYNVHDGYTITHGAYFDQDTILRAAANPLSSKISKW